MKNFKFHDYLTIWLFLAVLVFFHTWFCFISQEMSGNPVINRLKPWCSGMPWALCST